MVNILGVFKRHKILASALITFVVIASILGVQIGVIPHSQGRVVITIGDEAVAASGTNYPCNGTNDDVQFQAALDALPVFGGEIDILAGNYQFSHIVTRAINNVMFVGVGRATYCANDGIIPLFVAGGNGWVFSNLRTDTGSINMGATTGWAWNNVTIGNAYFAYYAPSGIASFATVQGVQGIQGEKGDKGDTGSQGVQGVQGEIGLTGAVGVQGLQGVAGYTPIKGIDYFDGIQGIQGELGLTGAKGDKGDTGIQGIQGIQGVKGDTGDNGLNYISTSSTTNLTGILTGNGSIVGSITDNHANWDAGYAYRLTSASGTTPLTLTLSGNALTGSVDLSAYETTLALSSWAGSSNITTLGTISSGIWHGDVIGDSYISSASTWSGKQAGSSILTALSGLSWSSGSPIVRMNGASSFTLDTATYLTGNQSISLGGILSGSGTTSITASAGSGYYMPSTSDQTNWNGKLSSVTGTNLDNVWSGTGILTRTGTATYSTITNNSSNWDAGYTYRLTSASGTAPLTLTLSSNGLTGSVDLSAYETTSALGTWTGSSNIATVGTVSGGTYNKVTITAPTTNATLTLAQGSSLITSGAYAITLTSTGTTGVTLPTSGTLFSSTTETPNANIPCGINNGNSAAQSQVVVAGSYYYITKSDIDLPATAIAGMKVGTRFVWRVAFTKTAAGTAGFSICIYRGINGSTSDTRDVTQSVGVSTAAVDSMVVDVQVTVLTTGATGSYYWSIIPVNKAVTATGFGVATGANGYFSGTVSSVAMNTASLKFGLGFMNTTGTPTIVIPLVEAQAFNMD